MKKLIAIIILVVALIPALAEAYVTVPLGRTGTTEFTMYPTDNLKSFTFQATSTTAASIFPYASTTAISSTASTFLATGGAAGSVQVLWQGTSTPPLDTTTGSGSGVGYLMGYNKTTAQSPGFIGVVTAGLNNNTTSVMSESGPCFNWYVGSNISGRVMGADCIKYDNPASFIAGARVNFISDINGVMQPWQMVNRVGNVWLGATTTGQTAPAARLTLLNINSSTQDILHCDQPTAFATSTVCAIGSTGNTGLGTSTVSNALTISGAVNSFNFLADDNSLSVVNGNTVFKLKVSTADNSGLTGRDEVASISAVADTADYAGIAAPTAWVFKTQDTSGVLAEGMRLNNARFLGIGTTTPSRALDVFTNNTIAGIFAGNGGTGAVGIGANSSGPFLNAYTNDSATANASTFQIQPGSGTVTIATGGGNVGIGTTTPPARITGYTTASTTTMLLDAVAGNGGCLMLKDVQGTGFTQVYSQAGVIYSKVSTSLTTCN